MAKKKVPENSEEIAAKPSRKPTIPMETVKDVVATMKISGDKIVALCDALATYDQSAVSFDGAGSIYRAMELLAAFEGELESLMTRTQRLSKFADRN